MSIFTRIKNAIFGDDDKRPDARSSSKAGAPTPARQAAPARPASPASSASPGGRETGPGNIVNARWDAPAAPANVDVEDVLEARAAQNPQKLNWRTSIVDLMKLLDIDSSLENRKELARELGFTGDTSDSASMNIWLHKRVMQELQNNGGRVPASLVA